MTKNLKFFAELALSGLLIIFGVILATNASYKSSVMQAISLWVAVVVPSLFPYFFITVALSKLSSMQRCFIKLSPVSHKLFRVSGICIYAYFISLISGYPIGAKVVSDLKNDGLISDSESARCACFCSTSSPAFLLMSVGQIMFNSKLFGILLYFIAVICSIISATIMRFYKPDDKPFFSRKPTPYSCDNLLYESVYSAVISLLTVGGIIVIFSLITSVLLNLGVLTPFIKLTTFFTKDYAVSKGVIVGIFESSGGLKLLSDIPLSKALPYCALITSFGGISVIAQSTAFLSKAKIKIAPFLINKIIQAILAFLIGALFSYCFLF